MHDELEEIVRWLIDHWPDRAFRASKVLHEHSGKYTLYCSIVKCDDREYILKYYNRYRGYGLVTEKLNYQLLGEHLLFPRLEAFFPKGTDSDKFLSYGVLLSYYPHKVSPAGISIVEVLAIGLSIATMFTCFAERGRIYFDLRSDSLRVDSEGGLHLIDFTDLITIEELVSRPFDCSGLPVIDRKSESIPPEGLKYQTAFEDLRVKKVSSAEVRKIAYAIDPEKYQIFSLAELIIELLVGPAASHSILEARIAQAGEPNDGAFTMEERVRLLDLLTSMRDPNDVDRPSFTEVREVFWSLLGPRLKLESIASDLISMRAAKLLRTISRRDGDSTSSQIHESLKAYWSTYRDGA